MPGCRNESSHAGGPNGIWLNYGAPGYPAPAVVVPAPVVAPAPVLPVVPAPNGKVMIASCEFSGWIVRIDVTTMTLTGELDVGGMPVDVKSSPDGTVIHGTLLHAYVTR